MFVRFFGKECRQIAKSLTFWLFIALILLMYFSQIGTDVNSLNNPVEPVAGQENYGSKTAENPETIMPLATQNLLSEYRSNSYVCYPLGFYKTVRLNGADQAKVAAVLGELTGRDPASFGGASPAGDGSFTIGGGGDGQGLSIEGGEGKVTVQFPDGTASEYSAGEAPQEYQDALGENAPTPPTGEKVEVQVTYERFLELMAQVDGLIGGRSSYDRDSMVGQFGFVPKTYEDALTEYQNFTEKDGVFGAYARLFSDYLGIVLSILPAFVAASLFLRDRRARMQELVYTRRASSAAVIGARFAALVVLLLVPVLLLSLVPLLQLLPIWGGRGLPLDYLAFAKYTFAWLAPSVLVSASLGMLLTVLTDTPVAVLVQAVWWFFDINNSSFGPQNGSVFQLAIRHNSLRRYEDFAANLSWITWNRIGYTLLALSLVALTVWLYEQKRRGKLDVGGKIHRLAAGFRGKHKARSAR